VSTEEIYDILISLGYSLQDRGSYWQTNAVFRQGDNKTAIQIYKDTGVWRDYVENTPPLKFERLIERSVGDDNSKLKKILNNKDFSLLENSSNFKKVKLTMETIYPTSSLKKLLPHYRFYNDKGISSEVLKSLQGGLATQGQLYQRFVFPIHNSLGQIHGFSGRDMLNKNERPKWKHIGRKSSWVYPMNSPSLKEFFSEGLNEIILVESIGDLLSLMEAGFKNVLVTFGLEVSPSLINALVLLNPKSIIISLNNDYNSEENRGLLASFKNYFKLFSYFDAPKLKICLPLANDFGDMNTDCFEKWSNKLDNINVEEQQKLIIKETTPLVKRNFFSKKLTKNRNLLKQIING
jgi:hypothetical protein